MNLIKRGLTTASSLLTARHARRAAEGPAPDAQALLRSVLDLADVMHPDWPGAEQMACGEAFLMARTFVKANRTQAGVWLLTAHSWGDEVGAAHYLPDDYDTSLRAAYMGTYLIEQMRRVG